VRPSLVRIVLVVAVAGGAVVSGGGSARAADAPSSGWNDWSCRPSAAHPEPVVMIHGLTGDGRNGDYMASALAGAGYCTFSLTYGRNDNFCGGAGTAPVAESAQEVAAFMEDVRAATGAAKVDLIGHSEGGFISLYIPKVLSINTRYDVFVALFTDLRDPPMAREPGVHHIWVQDVCPLDPVGHISLIRDPTVLGMVTNGLDPAHAGPVACGIGAPV
jgi:triacylglycerol esterase/lipase EstA (alpha/beta hydrolase family)